MILSGDAIKTNTSFVCSDNLCQFDIGITETDVAMLAFDMDGGLRTVVQTAETAFTLIEKSRAFVANLDVVTRAHLRARPAADADIFMDNMNR